MQSVVTVARSGGRKRQPGRALLPPVQQQLQKRFDWTPNSCRLADEFEIPRIDVVDLVLAGLAARVEALEVGRRPGGPAQVIRFRQMAA